MQSEALARSNWLAYKIADMYYVKGIPSKEIAQELGISLSTVSRFVNIAKNEGIVRLTLSEPYRSCIEYSEILKDKYGLRDVVLVPFDGKKDGVNYEMDIRKAVALEGARYLQRVLTENDILGISWGRTMSYVIHCLNPCQKSNLSFVTLHGGLSAISEHFDVKNLVSRIAMAMGGKRYVLEDEAVLKSPQILSGLKVKKENQALSEMYSKITISISGVGTEYPELESPLLLHPSITNADIKELQRAGACGDIALHFFDFEGRECDSSLKQRIFTIDYSKYKAIPCKIVVAAEESKAVTVRALLRGNLADVIVLDKDLAKAVIDII